LDKPWLTACQSYEQKNRPNAWGIVSKRKDFRLPFGPLARLAQNEELGCAGREARSRRRMGQKEMAMTGKNRIMIYGPKNDGTYIVEFRTAAQVSQKP